MRAGRRFGFISAITLELKFAQNLLDLWVVNRKLKYSDFYVRPQQKLIRCFYSLTLCALQIVCTITITIKKLARNLLSNFRILCEIEFSEYGDNVELI